MAIFDNMGLKTEVRRGDWYCPQNAVLCISGVFAALLCLDLKLVTTLKNTTENATNLNVPFNVFSVSQQRIYRLPNYTAAPPRRRCYLFNKAVTQTKGLQHGLDDSE